MGKTIAEKILEMHTVEGNPEKGNYVMAAVDLVLMNDITAPPAIAAFEKIGVETVFDRKKIALVPDQIKTLNLPSRLK